MNNNKIDPTLGALLITAITALILKIRVKINRKKPDGSTDTDVSVDFQGKEEKDVK